MRSLTILWLHLAPRRWHTARRRNTFLRPSPAPLKSLSTLNRVHLTSPRRFRPEYLGSPGRKEKLFSSVQELARAANIPHATVHRRLTKSLGFVRRLLHWVPHLLSDAQKVRRVELSLSLLQILEVQEQRAWHDVVTLDESWFYCCTDHESKWLPLGEKVPERPHVTLQCEKLMITSAWNPSGFHLILCLPSGCKLNSRYHRRETLEPF
jgi:hypothetical protein